MKLKLTSILGVVLVIMSVVMVYQLTEINTGIRKLTGNVVQVGEDKAPTAAPPPSAPSAPSPTLDMKALLDDDAVKGDPNAPVTIVEWSDFECPYCGRFYRDTYGQIEKDYIDTGKVKLVYRDFPLSFHAQAQKAAEAAECADEQDKFWEMHNKLFESGVSGGVDSFKAYAGELGLDQAKFDDCLDSGKTAAEIKKDIADGSAIGIRGTPGFVINGQLVSGAQPYANFKQIIDAELAK